MPIPINTKLLEKLKFYKKHFLIKKYESLDESATRIMINHFMTEVLGYTPIDDLKTEYAIKGTFADYIVQIDKKKRMVVEVKAIQIDLSEAHLRQAIGYASNEGIDWILLTNGRQFSFYRVIFGKPVTTKLLFTANLLDEADLKKNVYLFELFTKKMLLQLKPESYWKRYSTLESTPFSKLMYSPEIVSQLRKIVSKKAGIKFSDEEIIDAIYKVILLPIPTTKPKSITPLSKKEKVLTETLN